MMILWLTFLPGVLSGQSSQGSFHNFEKNLERSKIRSTENIKPPDAKTKCLSGWYVFGEKCFRSGGWRLPERLSWEKAMEKCAEYGAELASIHSTEEQEFLIAFILLNVHAGTWIGLHDRANESHYQWEDHSEVDFTNWNEFEPTGLKDDKEDCVEMRFAANIKTIGKWNDIDCNVKKPYICQMYTDSVNAGLNPKYCPESIGGGYSFQDSCYHIIKETKNWSGAESYCQTQYSGHLVSIQDFTSQKYLNYILQDLRSSAAYWIGIKIPDKGPLQWTSGWHVSFTKWEEHFSRQLTKGSCVVRMKTGHWDAEPCEEKFPFICEVTPRKAPVLEPSAEGATCPEKPDGWIDLGGDFCYFFDTESSSSWYEANFNCIRRGGTLVSIHSLDEVESIEQFVRYTQTVFHIGLFRNHDDDFVWADGSGLDFLFWEENEPNSKNERCVEMITETMGWNDIGCESRRSYVCSIKKKFPNATSVKDSDTCSGGLSVSAVTGVAICILLVILLLGVFVYFCRPWEKEPSRLRKISQDFLHGPKRNKVPEMVIKEDCDYYENTK